MMLLASIQARVCAQENGRIKGMATSSAEALSNTDKTFELPPNKIHRQFVIDLGRGNKMQVELDNPEDIDHFLNIDSLLRVFLHDIEPLKDSLSDELASRRIDYIADSSGRKKIRIRQSAPQGSSFVIDKGELAALKLEQDTVNFLGSSRFQVHYLLEKWLWKTRPYRLSLFVNNLNELPALAGKLNELILSLKQNIDSKLVTDNNGVMHLKNDYVVTVKQPQGFVAGTNDDLEIENSANLQNYKNYFVPSFSLGLSLNINGASNKLYTSLVWEPNFFFQSNNGKLQTYRNDFLTLSFGTSSITESGINREAFRMAIFSLSYLIRREGEFFDKNTFRFGFGEVNIFKGATTLAPVMYFNNFFKGVTPGIRLIQRF
jgi:hypothetical protein